ncbi:FadR/GntR family transcriptional regulator [Bacillus massiliglaciei]|uniref:FadR/GntR family transcriptional regulator n=1 Tax=Bacillus massiliglaciei TaxID=1816693 RepID=UPI000B1815A8|nr:GntR family transcriptional regulator [Bacillus massiliglaciei]
MNDRQQSSKIYLDVVENLRRMIEEDGLVSGDKIPSERELSDRMQVGRSSVREALRALELLGLIETRRGEGTFIKDFQEHRLVELLGTFFLQNEKVKQDLSETKRLLEIDCLRILVSSASEDELNGLIKWAETAEFTDDEFFMKIAIVNRNRLLERIWRIVNSYSKAVKGNAGHTQKENYLQLLQCILVRDEGKVIGTYLMHIRNMSKQE